MTALVTVVMEILLEVTKAPLVIAFGIARREPLSIFGEPQMLIGIARRGADG